MPYLKLKTNVPINKQQTSQLMGQLSQLLAKETGKSERYVMVELSADRDMIFSGDHEPLAYLECKSIGLTSVQAKALSAAISRILQSDLQLSPERIYIEFSNCPAEYWGWNGGTFA